MPPEASPTVASPPFAAGRCESLLAAALLLGAADVPVGPPSLGALVAAGLQAAATMTAPARIDHLIDRRRRLGCRRNTLSMSILLKLFTIPGQPTRSCRSPHTWIECGLCQIRDRVGEHGHQCGESDSPDRHRVVKIADGTDGQETETRQTKGLLNK